MGDKPCPVRTERLKESHKIICAGPCISVFKKGQGVRGKGQKIKEVGAKNQPGDLRQAQGRIEGG